MAVLQKRVRGAQCSYCAFTIERALSRLEGVRSVRFNPVYEEVRVEYDPGVVGQEEIEGTLRRLGFEVDDRGWTGYGDLVSAERRRLILSMLLALPSGAGMLIMKMGLASGLAIEIAMLALAVASIALPGRDYIYMAYHAFKRRILNQHVLMAAGALGGLLGGLASMAVPGVSASPGEFFAASAFIVGYHALGGYAGAYIRKTGEDAVRGILDLQPRRAVVRRGARWVEVDSGEIVPGDRLLLRPGERSPVDGVIVSGYGVFDESLLTGESRPVSKGPGGSVLGGSLLLEGPVEVEALRDVESSYPSYMAGRIREFRALKPKIIVLLERVLRVYVPAVLLVGVASLVFWSVAPLAGIQGGVSKGLEAMMTTLVMGYPCGLGMAVPLAMLRGGYRAAAKGIVFKSPEPFHVLSSRSLAILFDKTGTLTDPNMRVARIVAHSGGEDSVLRLAACLESYARHPIAEAILREAARRLGEIECSVEDVRVLKGTGVEGIVDGVPAFVGKPPSRPEYRRLEAEGFTLAYVESRDGAVKGVVCLEEKLKEGAVEAVMRIKSMGFTVAMATGDSESNAARVAKALGINIVRARASPEDKARLVEELRSAGYKVVMVGDGINDTLSLTMADASIALGSGLEAARAAADVVITGGDVRLVVEAIEAARAMYGKTRENLFLAFTLNGLGVPLAAAGLIEPYWAMVAMVASLTLLIANSMASTTLSSISIFSRLPLLS